MIRKEQDGGDCVRLTVQDTGETDPHVTALRGVERSEEFVLILQVQTHPGQSLDY